ncbi:hypothetical protein [Pseudomonas sp. GM_Psu_2]|uniref:hypothetical protein n=1 Tax=unclassified Pseudomonas TaxID=196821 RepID=UPI002269D65A|nr:hypothetical protein [Pseudomonas sp. GM_Psu_2]
MALQKTALEIGYEVDIGGLASATSRAELQTRVKALLIAIGESDLPLTAINSLLTKLMQVLAEMLAKLAPDEPTAPLPQTSEVSTLDHLLADLDRSAAEADLKAVQNDKDAQAKAAPKGTPPHTQSNDTRSRRNGNGNKRGK